MEIPSIKSPAVGSVSNKDHVVQIFDRQNKFSPGYFTQIKNDPVLLTFFKNIINSYKELDIDKSVLIRMNNSISNNKPYYAKDLLKIMNAVKSRDSHKVGKKEFNRIFEKIEEILKYEESTTLNSTRYAFQLNRTILQKLQEICKLSESSSEKVYLRHTIEISKNHREVVVDLQHLASIVNNIADEKKTMVEGKVELAVQLFNSMKRSESSNEYFLCESDSSETDSCHEEEHFSEDENSKTKDQKISHSFITTASLYLEPKEEMKDLESNSVTDSENRKIENPERNIDASGEFIKKRKSIEIQAEKTSLSPNFASGEKLKKRKTSQTKQKGSYSIIYRYNPNNPCSFQTVRFYHKEALRKIFNNADVNENIKKRIFNQVNMMSDEVVCNAADLWILLNSFLSKNSNQQFDTDFLKYLKKYYEVSQKALQNELQTCSDVPYIFKIRFSTLEKILRCSSLDNDSEIRNYFNGIIQQKQGVKNLREDFIVDMERLVNLIQSVNNPASNFWNIENAVKNFEKMKQINNETTSTYKTYFSKDFLSIKFEIKLEQLKITAKPSIFFAFKNNRKKSPQENAFTFNVSKTFLENNSQIFEKNSNRHPIIDRFNSDHPFFKTISLNRKSYIKSILDECSDINENIKNRIQSKSDLMSSKIAYNPSDIWILVNHFLSKQSEEKLDEDFLKNIKILYEASREALLDEIKFTSESRFVLMIRYQTLEQLLKLKSISEDSASMKYLRNIDEKKSVQLVADRISAESVVVDMDHLAALFNPQLWNNFNSNKEKPISKVTLYSFESAINTFQEMKKNQKKVNEAIYKKYFSLNVLNIDFENSKGIRDNL